MNNLPRPSLSSSFWTRPDVIDALHEQDAGVLFRLTRQYTGASQQDIGVAVDMAQPHVSAIMSGRRHVTALRTWQRIAEGLAMPSHARDNLGLASSESTHCGRESTRRLGQAGTRDLWSAPTIVQDIVESTMGDVVRRREALASAGALVVGMALTEALEPWLLPPKTLVSGPGRLSEVEIGRIEAATAALPSLGRPMAFGHTP